MSTIIKKYVTEQNRTFLNFLIFYEIKPLKKKKIRKNWFDEQENLEIRKKRKNFKAIQAALGHSKTKTFSVFFENLPLPPPPPFNKKN